MNYQNDVFGQEEQSPFDKLSSKLSAHDVPRRSSSIQRISLSGDEVLSIMGHLMASGDPADASRSSAAETDVSSEMSSPGGPRESRKVPSRSSSDHRKGLRRQGSLSSRQESCRRLNKDPSESGLPPPPPPAEGSPGSLRGRRSASRDPKGNRARSRSRGARRNTSRRGSNEETTADHAIKRRSKSKERSATGLDSSSTHSVARRGRRPSLVRRDGDDSPRKDTSSEHKTRGGSKDPEDHRLTTGGRDPKQTGSSSDQRYNQSEDNSSRSKEYKQRSRSKSSYPSSRRDDKDNKSSPQQRHRSRDSRRDEMDRSGHRTSRRPRSRSIDRSSANIQIGRKDGPDEESSNSRGWHSSRSKTNKEQHRGASLRRGRRSSNRSILDQDKVEIDESPIVSRANGLGSASEHGTVSSRRNSKGSSRRSATLDTRKSLNLSSHSKCVTRSPSVGRKELLDTKKGDDGFDLLQPRRSSPSKWSQLKSRSYSSKENTKNGPSPILTTKEGPSKLETSKAPRSTARERPTVLTKDIAGFIVEDENMSFASLEDWN